MPAPATTASGKTGPAPAGPKPAPGTTTGGYATPPGYTPPTSATPNTASGYGGVYNPLNLHNVDKSFRDPKGFVEEALGMGGATPNNYNASGQLDYSQGMSANVYNEAMRQRQLNETQRAPQATIAAQTVATPGAINAQTINTPGLVGGAEADALRAQQLQQAATAASSPSSAAAQMRAAGGQIANQQLGVAAAARGADRGAARRDAMLGIGAQGQVAANQTAAVAAQEQAAKQQAYTAALGGVRAGDVSTTQAQTQIGALNQGTNLQAQQATAGNTLTAAQANQGAHLQAQMGTVNTQLAGWQAQQAAQNAAMGTALQATGATNQAQAVASGYGQSQNAAETQTKAGLVGAAGSIIGGLFKSSDERTKDDLGAVGGGSPYSGYASTSADPESPYFTGTGKGMDFLSGRADKDPLGATTSDERAKQEVESMRPGEMESWASKVNPITFRYRPGFEDGGDDVHLGVSAQKLEQSGPLGRLMVHHDPETGMRKVDYGALALMLSKAALEKATRKGAR